MLKVRTESDKPPTTIFHKKSSKNVVLMPKSQNSKILQLENGFFLQNRLSFEKCHFQPPFGSAPEFIIVTGFLKFESRNLEATQNFPHFDVLT